MKTPAKLGVYLARVIVMKSAERQAVIEQNAAVRHVERRHSHAVFLAERFPQRNVKRGVLRQIIPRILRVRHAIRETRPVINVRRSKRLPRKYRVEPHVQSVSLVVVHR